MDPASTTSLVQSLSLAALLASTLQYRLLMTKREARRIEARLRAEAQADGLRGLVRVMLADPGDA